jgi:acyl-CoA synthetase (NDP forming)/GNAT superfamily N-acetyltransferase
MATSPSTDAMERDVLTTNGMAIHIRPACADDVAAIEQFHSVELSDTSAYFRFFGIRPHLSQDTLQQWATADGQRDATLLALHEDRVVGVGLYRHVDEERADAAFAVADRLHGNGVATLLLEDLAVLARAAGYRELIAETLPSNIAMRGVFRSSGLAVTSHFEGGITDVLLPLADGAAMELIADERDRKATAASMHTILVPSSVVVIGAGASSTGPANTIVRNLRSSFHGAIFVVHPTVTTIEQLPAFTSVSAIAQPIDLAIIATPASVVADVIDDCGSAGVRSVVIVSGGFSEATSEGAQREAEVLERARRHGIRVVGPNSFGVANPALGLDATFGLGPIRSGSIAFASQSSGLAIALLAEIGRRNLGTSSFVSLGNKVDVSSNDLLSYWDSDDTTRVIALYLESFGNPRKFARLARTVSLRRPIVALKGGRTATPPIVGQVSSAVLATDDAVVDALFSHSGVVRARTMDELIDIADVFDSCPLPAGIRVAIVGNAGGPLRLTSDTASAHHLSVSELSGELQERIQQIVPTARSASNPIDLAHNVSGPQLHDVVELIEVSGEVDMVVVVTVALPGDDISEAGGGGAAGDGAASDGAAGDGAAGDGAAGDGAAPRTMTAHPIGSTHQIPVVMVHMGAQLQTSHSFSTPERAIGALSRMVEYARWRKHQHAGDPASADPASTSPAAPTPTPSIVMAAAHARKASLHDDGWLTMEDTIRLVSDCGISMPPYFIVDSPRELDFALTSLEGPVALKADAAGIVNKYDAGAVALDVRSMAEGERVLARFNELFPTQLRSVLVQRQCEAGVEVMVGINRSERYGPLLIIGAGGRTGELLGDTTVLIAPASRAEIIEAVGQLRIAPLLTGDNHHHPLALDALIDLIERVGLLALAMPELIELDVNPIIVTATNAWAVDVRARRGSSAPTPLRGLRPALVH